MGEWREKKKKGDANKLSTVGMYVRVALSGPFSGRR